MKERGKGEVMINQSNVYYRMKGEKGMEGEQNIRKKGWRIGGEEVKKRRREARRKRDGKRRRKGIRREGRR